MNHINENFDLLSFNPPIHPSHGFIPHDRQINMGNTRVDVVAEGPGGVIEDDGEMGGPVPGIGLLQELPQHVAIALRT